MSLVEVTGFLPHDEALTILATASAVLAAGPARSSERLRGQVAAKLPEYLATGLPVIYIGDTSCDAADMLREHDGCHVVSTDDADGAVQALWSSRNGPVKRTVDSLSRRTLTARLAELLDRSLTS
jgi:glycosyltransferase involved in cell wall biosynthesis